MGTLEKAVVVRELPQLLLGRLNQFFATIARIHAPQPGHAVEYLLVVGIVDIYAVRPRNNAAFLFAQILVVRKRMEIVIAIEES
jgi:hypothetical protein